MKKKIDDKELEKVTGGENTEPEKQNENPDTDEKTGAGAWCYSENKTQTTSAPGVIIITTAHR